MEATCIEITLVQQDFERAWSSLEVIEFSTGVPVKRDESTAAIRWASTNHFGLAVVRASQSPQSQVFLPQSGFCACARQELRIKFERFLAEWREQRDFISNYDRIVACPGHLKIVAMGRDALPLIMKELEKGSADPFFRALELITSAQPVRHEDRGNLEKMNKAWLDWWRPQD